ncbi:hypothetical protein A2159_02930 [Candidatus Woesebacteria bacterium RBG_13_34_9]|uniref:Methyltransferase type 11 domain-containing protein n=1 Tax=Candidatus Woesebacteria bacterium RBG_13_34_9 TaxID=1802477 RepID=A0A1F7X5Y9_9BACT|nr:MAG: hypothetical protein A2159_02930 [Candidatus Woesebacteria bacterium RBG_13_34_9]
MNDNFLSEKSIDEYLAWATENPIGKIPKDVSREGAGENRIPLTHLANSLPVYLIFKDILEKSKISKASILEIGCGTGRSISFIKESLHKKVFNIIAIDYSKACISYAQKRYGKSGVIFKSYKGKILPFKNNSFNFILSSHVIEHIPKKHQALFVSEISRVLKTGGMAIIGAPNRKYCQDVFCLNPKDTKKYRFIMPHEHENYLSEVHLLFSNEKRFSKYKIWQTTNLINRKLFKVSVKFIKPSKNFFSNLKFELYYILRKNSILQDFVARLGTELQLKRKNLSHEDIIKKTSIFKKGKPDNGDNYIVMAVK